MGNCTSTKKGSMKPTNFFENQRYEQEAKKKAEREARKNKNQKKPEKPKPGQQQPESILKVGRVDQFQIPTVSYDDESTKILKDQIRNNPDAFLLNNIMLSIQFFENYERVNFDLKNNTITQSDIVLNKDMAHHQKHVLLPDKLFEHVNIHVQFQNKYEDLDKTNSAAPRKAVNIGKPIAKTLIPLQSQRMYVIHDNIEVNEPEEVSDYSTVIGAPFYKMVMERSDEPGFIKLRKLEGLEIGMLVDERRDTLDAIELDQSTESESDSSTSDSNDNPNLSHGKNFLDSLKESINQPPKPIYKVPDIVKQTNDQINDSSKDSTERRPSGILKYPNNAMIKGQLNKTKPIKSRTPEAIYNPLSDSSGYTSRPESIASESDYGYSTITAETTPKRLEMSSSARFSDSTSVIPTKCITIIKVKRLPMSSDEDDEDEIYNRNSNSPQNLYREIYYLNSDMFMLNFNDIFLLKLYQTLGFSLDETQNATTQGASIYCSSMNKDIMKSFEIMPAVNSIWPLDAAEWIWRKRNIIRSPRTQFTYQWPTKGMIEKCRGLGCSIIPLGYRPSRGTNSDKGLQWKLGFPAVERYLEATMAHSQVRCYIFAIALFRSFMKIESSYMGLECSHIKNHLFWQLEENFARWPEDRLGEALMLFLNSLYDHIKRGELPDFFLPQCNLLKSIPKSILLKQQRRLADIRESPVMHLLASLRNLKYIKKNYYPVLNYKKLYHILTTEDILRLANPALPILVNNEDEEKDEFNQKSFWEEQRGGNVNNNDNPEYNWRRNQLRLKNAMKQKQLKTKAPPKFQIDRKKKIGEFDMNRRRLVLQLFIPHFISMAECSEKFEAPRQALIYLEHARRLVTLLSDEPGGQMEAADHKSKIEVKIKAVMSNTAKTGAPKVPRRNESFANTPSTSGNKIMSEKYTSYPNENDTDSQIIYRHQPDSPTIKINFPKLITVDVHTDNDRPRSQRVVSLQNLEEEEADESNDFEESKL